MIRISGIVNDSIVDGPGVRLTIFAQGCKHNCLGCHNPDTHSFTGGTLITRDEIVERIKENPLLCGVTFSGGDPFEQADKFAELGIAIKELKLGLNIITYTGYKHEAILQSKKEGWKELLDVTDILIDGPFELDKRSLECRFRGSTNQRVIDVKDGAIINF